MTLHIFCSSTAQCSPFCQHHRPHRRRRSRLSRRRSRLRLRRRSSRRRSSPGVIPSDSVWQKPPLNHLPVSRKIISNMNGAQHSCNNFCETPKWMIWKLPSRNQMWSCHRFPWPKSLDYVGISPLDGIERCAPTTPLSLTVLTGWQVFDRVVHSDC